MGSPVLLLRLEGPLQAWGTRARWDVRDTAPEPTKSGVIGLLGCALGILRGDPRMEALDRGLRFGVRIDSPGRVRSDYQTVTGFLPKAEGGFRHRGGTSDKPYDEYRPEQYGHLEPATIISPRYYLEDASFLVGFEKQAEATVDSDDLLTECASALADPVWPIFLGRRSCPPSRPVYDPERDGLRDEYDGLEDALKRHEWSCLGSGLRKRDRSKAPVRLTAYIEDRSGNLTRQDAIRVNPARIYDFRQVAKLSIEDL